MRNQFLQHIEQTFKDCLDIVKAKNSDYAELADPFKNFKTSEVVGVPVPRAILVRLMDKITRISNLLDREAVVKDEKIEDSIRDAINYLAILTAYLDD